MNEAALLALLFLAGLSGTTVFFANKYYNSRHASLEYIKAKAAAELAFLGHVHRIHQLTALHPNEDVKRVGESLDRVAGIYADALRVIGEEHDF